MSSDSTGGKRLRLAAAAALLLVSATSCAGESGASAVVNAAHGITVAGGTARMNVATNRPGSGADAMNEEGVVSFSKLTSASTLVSGPLKMEKLRLGSTAYLKNLALSPNPWLKVDLANLPSPAGPSAILAKASEPSGALDLLKSFAGEAQEESTATVRGVETKQYRAAINVDKSTGAAKLKPEVDVWIDKEGRVRRLAYEIDDTTRVKVAIEFWDFGVKADVKSPPDDQVTDAFKPVLPRSPSEHVHESGALPDGFVPLDIYGNKLGEPVPAEAPHSDAKETDHAATDKKSGADDNH